MNSPNNGTTWTKFLMIPLLIFFNVFFSLSCFDCTRCECVYFPVYVCRYLRLFQISRNVIKITSMWCELLSSQRIFFPCWSFCEIGKCWTFFYAECFKCGAYWALKGQQHSSESANMNDVVNKWWVWMNM